MGSGFNGCLSRIVMISIHWQNNIQVLFRDGLNYRYNPLTFFFPGHRHRTRSCGLSSYIKKVCAFFYHSIGFLQGRLYSFYSRILKKRIRCYIDNTHVFHIFKSKNPAVSQSKFMHLSAPFCLQPPWQRPSGCECFRNFLPRWHIL